MYGLPGSGKSYKARQIQEQDGGIILSTDSIFDVEMGNKKVYLWNRQALREAHHVNMIKCLTATEREITPIIIDNTNLTEKERESYKRIAEVAGYTFKIVKADMPWSNDPEACFRKCTHEVPLETIYSMFNKRDLG